MTGNVDGHTVEQVRNVVALVTWALEADSRDLDDVAGDIVHALTFDDRSANVAAFVSVVVGLLERLAIATGRPRTELWSEISATLARNLGGDHLG